MPNDKILTLITALLVAGSANADPTIDRLIEDYKVAREKCHEYTVAEAADCRSRQKENALDLIGLYIDTPDPERLAKATAICDAHENFAKASKRTPQYAYTIRIGCIEMYFDTMGQMREMGDRDGPIKERMNAHSLAAMNYCQSLPGSQKNNRWQECYEGYQGNHRDTARIVFANPDIDRLNKTFDRCRTAPEEPEYNEVHYGAMSRDIVCVGRIYERESGGQDNARK